MGERGALRHLSALAEPLTLACQKLVAGWSSCASHDSSVGLSPARLPLGLSIFAIGQLAHWWRTWHHEASCRMGTKRYSSPPSFPSHLRIYTNCDLLIGAHA